MRKITVAAAAGLAAILTSGTAMAGKDLDAIKARGSVICGVPAGGIAGFGLVDTQGKWSGLDIDVCRATAAAIFGDAEKVKYVPLTAQQRRRRYPPRGGPDDSRPAPSCCRRRWR